MSNVGDELTFLKRTHQLLESGRMVVKIHGKHLDQLCTVATLKALAEQEFTWTL